MKVEKGGHIAQRAAIDAAELRLVLRVSWAQGTANEDQEPQEADDQREGRLCESGQLAHTTTSSYHAIVVREGPDGSDLEQLWCSAAKIVIINRRE